MGAMRRINGAIQQTRAAKIAPLIGSKPPSSPPLSRPTLVTLMASMALVELLNLRARSWRSTDRVLQAMASLGMVKSRQQLGMATLTKVMELHHRHHLPIRKTDQGSRSN